MITGLTWILILGTTAAITVTITIVMIIRRKLTISKSRGRRGLTVLVRRWR
jgi:hypothetical protein